jgi:hypothetical protein
MAAREERTGQELPGGGTIKEDLMGAVVVTVAAFLPLEQNASTAGSSTVSR